MDRLTVTLLVVIYIGAVALVTAFIVIAFIRGLKTRAGLPYKPIPIVFPPVPVEPGAAVSVVGWLGIIWAAAHLAATVFWLWTSYLVPRTAPAVIVALYLSFAALLVGLGGLTLNRARAMGRPLISWGMALFTLLTFYGLIISFLLPSLEGVSLAVRQQGRLIGTLIAIHLIFDVAVGAAAQRVGRPADWAKRKIETPEQLPPITEPAGPMDNLERQD